MENPHVAGTLTTRVEGGRPRPVDHLPYPAFTSEEWVHAFH